MTLSYLLQPQFFFGSKPPLLARDWNSLSLIEAHLFAHSFPQQTRNVLASVSPSNQSSRYWYISGKWENLLLKFRNFGDSKVDNTNNV